MTLPPPGIRRAAAFGVALCLLPGGRSLFAHQSGAFATQARTSSGGAALVSIDPDVDGRSDVRERFREGHLVERASDRNFDDHVDRVDDFDPVNGECVRSVVDVDLDGTADVLLLFRSGRVVFSEVAHGGVQLAAAVANLDAAPVHAGAGLLPMADPFASDFTLRTSLTPRTPVVTCLATAGGVPACCFEPAAPFAEPFPLAPPSCSAPSRARRPPPPSRGPPSLHSL